MKNRTKKIIKWGLISFGSLVVVLALTLIILVVLKYNEIYQSIPYVERESSYVMPEFPESDVVPITDESFDIDDTSINETSSESVPPPIYIVEPIDENILNILLIGRDVADSSGSNGRSDSMMLLSYNKTTGEIALTSFLRDSLVPIEGHNWNRLNATYSWGGVGLTINTINEVFGLDIQHYITVDYDGFKKLVDNVDGVTVNITDVEAEYMNTHYSLGVTAGEVTFNGENALNFARIRKIAVSGGDFNRTERQRRIIVSAISKTLDMNDLGKTISIVNDSLPYIKTNLSSGTIISLVSDFLSKKNLEINTGAVPADGTWFYATYKKMSIIELDYEKNKTILYERIFGKD